LFEEVLQGQVLSVPLPAELLPEAAGPSGHAGRLQGMVQVRPGPVLRRPGLLVLQEERTQGVLPEEVIGPSG
jgi:hypothetical protein